MAAAEVVVDDGNRGDPEGPGAYMHATTRVMPEHPDDVTTVEPLPADRQ